MADTTETNEKKITLPAGASKETGFAGTIIQSGTITGEEYNRDLIGLSANRIYEYMRRSDATVRQALQIVKLPILSADWGVKAATTADDETSAIAEEKRQFIHDQLFNGDVDFPAALKSAMTCYDFGFSILEKVFKAVRYEGKWMVGLEKLASRKQKTILRWETDDGKLGVTQMNGIKTAYIPMEKILLFNFDREGDNYEGTALLRYCYKDWDIKDKLILVNAMSLEKHGMGVPVITEKEGQTATPQDRQMAIDALMNMRANNRAYMELPQTLGVEMLDMKAQSVKDILPTINYHDGRIMTAVLARFMEIGGASGSGAQSLAKDLSSLFMKSEEAMAKDIATVFNQLIRELCDFNWSDMSEGYPTITFGSIADDDNAALADAVSSLVSAGAIKPDLDLDNDLRKRFRLPVVAKEVADHYYDQPEVPGLDNDPDNEEDSDEPKGKEAEKLTDAEKKKAGLKEKDEIEATIDDIRTARNRLLASLAA